MFIMLQNNCNVNNILSPCKKNDLEKVPTNALKVTSFYFNTMYSFPLTDMFVKIICFPTITLYTVKKYKSV